MKLRNVWVCVYSEGGAKELSEGLVPVHSAMCGTRGVLAPPGMSSVTSASALVHFSSCDGLTWYHVVVSLCVLLRKIKWSIFHMLAPDPQSDLEFSLLDYKWLYTKCYIFQISYFPYLRDNSKRRDVFPRMSHQE